MARTLASSVDLGERAEWLHQELIRNVRIN